MRTIPAIDATASGESVIAALPIVISGYQGGMNHIVIQDNAVYMSDADCPDKLCVHTGTIHKTSETIVCLPHRVVVEITGTTDTFDAVVQ